MLTVSLHKIHIHAPVGLYRQEHVLYNQFEVDVDVKVAAGSADAWPMIDYARLNQVVQDAFLPGEELLETLVRHIYEAIRQYFPEAALVKVALRKMHPPMPGNIAYAQVCFEA
jgi:7,8-dihydroneopterin aldolase/epimerase/oxygenase